jgi:hypothetical protein
VLLHCFSGCRFESIVAALGLRLSDLFDDAPAQRNGRPAPRPATPTIRPAPQPTTTTDTAPATPAAIDDEPPVPEGLRPDVWRRIARVENGCWAIDERDASGAVIGTAYRRADGSKSCRPGSRRGLIYTPPLPDDAGFEVSCPILVAEGPTDTAALLQLGFIAVGVPMAGACGPELAVLLKGLHAALVADADRPGRRGAAALARHLAGACLSVRIIEPPGGAKDVRESLINGATREDYEALIRDAKPWRPEPAAAEPAPVGGAPVIVRLLDVQPEPVAWLWPGRIAMGKLTLIAGDPGLGKSLLTLDLAARVSAGAGWPDRPGERFEPGGVVLLSAEDDLADTVRPRLDAAGADCSRIVAIKGVSVVGDCGAVVGARLVDFVCDLPALEQAIRAVEGCRLVIIDPLTAYLGAVDSHKNAEIRGLLAPLADLAARHRIAVVGVTHLNKATGGPALYRTSGSLAFVAAARAAWLVTKDRDDPHRRLMLPAKNNLSGGADGLAFRIGGGPRVEWVDGPVPTSADEALAASWGGSGEGRSEVADAVVWLRDLLEDGPRPSREVLAAAREAGYSARTLARARAVVGVRARKGGFDGAWVLELPQHRSAEECQPPQECQRGEVGILRENPGSYSKNANFEGVASFAEGWHSSCPPPVVPLPPGLEGPPAPAWRCCDPNDAPADDRPRGRFHLDVE